MRPRRCPRMGLRSRPMQMPPLPRPRFPLQARPTSRHLPRLRLRLPLQALLRGRRRLRYPKPVPRRRARRCRGSGQITPPEPLPRASFLPSRRPAPRSAPGPSRRARAQRHLLPPRHRGNRTGFPTTMPTSPPAARTTTDRLSMSPARLRSRLLPVRALPPSRLRGRRRPALRQPSPIKVPPRAFRRPSRRQRICCARSSVTGSSSSRSRTDGRRVPMTTGCRRRSDTDGCHAAPAFPSAFVPVQTRFPCFDGGIWPEPGRT